MKFKKIFGKNSTGLNEREREGTVEFYRVEKKDENSEKKFEYRWRIIAPNGNNIANGGEGYENLKDCENGLESVRWHIDNSPRIKKW